MTRKVEELLEQALSLPLEERADLAASLLDSLEGPGDPDVEEAWAHEVERRIRDVETGRVKLIPWAEARRRLRQTLNARKRA
jgi:putative addiction module component (TIGR02574 family)